MNPVNTNPPPAQRPAARPVRRRWLPWLGALLLAGLIVAGAWPRPASVETARLSPGPLRTTINEEGRTRIRQRYVVAAPVTGQLRRLPFKAGAAITNAGEVIAIIDPVPPTPLDARSRSLAEARRDSARAALEKSRAAQFFASNDLYRAEQMRTNRLASAQELEQAQWREIAAARELNSAASALRLAEAELAEFGGTNATLVPVEVRAPATGRILKVIEESSRVVTAGTPLCELGDPSDLEAVIEVLSRDGTGLQPGTPVELEQWGGGEPLQARVRFVEPAAFTKISALGVEEQRVNVVVDLLTPPGSRGNLGDQFRVEARIITWESNRVLKASNGALFRRGQQWHAFVVENGRARLRSVVIGQAGATETEIRTGLREGDEVILYPGDRITDGQRVQPMKL